MDEEDSPEANEVLREDDIAPIELHSGHDDSVDLDFQKVMENLYPYDLVANDANLASILNHGTRQLIYFRCVQKCRCV